MRIFVIAICVVINSGYFVVVFFNPGIRFPPYYYLNPFISRVDIHNQALLDPVWLGPLTTHVLVLITVLYIMDTVRYAVGRK